MDYRNHTNQSTHGRLAFELRKQRVARKSVIFTVCAVIALAASSWAANPPEAPSRSVVMNAPMIEVPASAPQISDPHIVDKKFIGLAFISTSSTFADSYTTLFARENWFASKKGVCNAEVESAYLYGTHPTIGRAYAVASAKSAGMILVTYYLRRHHSKYWSAPFVANSLVSLTGVTQNMKVCN